jgi:hypothetical protein
LLVLGITLSLPIVQTKIGTYVTEMLNKDFKTDIKVDQVTLTIFGGVKLKKVMIKDHHKDTLIYADRVQTNILSFEKLYNGDLFFGDVRIDGLFFNLKTYKGENTTSINVFVDLFGPGDPNSKKHFLLKANNVYLSNSHFAVFDDNKAISKEVDFTKLNISASHFQIYGPEVMAKINKLSFKDERGLFIENLSSPQFVYTKKHILLNDFELLTKNSNIKGTAALNYTISDFSDFLNKVKFDVKVNEGYLSTTDIRHFYNELGRGKVFDIKSRITGPLNNLTFHKLKLIDAKRAQIIGDVTLKNSFGTEHQIFSMKGNFLKINSNYDYLVAMLPNVLGKTLPVSLKKLGQFDIKATTEVTKTTVSGNFFIKTAIGNVKSNLVMSQINNFDKAKYAGKVELDNFNIGAFLSRSDVGNVSTNLDIKGTAFSQKYLNTAVSGKVFKLYYNKYNYTNIALDGNFKSPVFKGKLNINDPNLFMDFDGLIDISKKEHKYDFRAKIDYANLRNLNFKKDSISIFKGDIKINIAGNTIDNLYGSLNISQAAYQNQKNNYIFDDFQLTSTFDADRVRTISVLSPDVIEGKLVGKFKFNQLQKMVENAAGSLYANYKPNKIIKGQFLKFNFSIYNKIVDIFYPSIELGLNTNVHGNINSDKEEFKFNFSSPTIKAFNASFDKIKIDIDNKNPLYNAFIEMDSVKTKYYKISNFSLINVTAKDTLFVRSEFKGGNQAEDYYNLNLYHTIDKNKNSVVGIKKSELKFKDYLWFLNENDLKNNKIVFDKKLKNFAIEDVLMTHENQKMELSGKLQGNTYKDLQLNFENVNLAKILPSIDSLKVAGNLNGNINVKQNNSIYQPTSSLKVDNLAINSINLGALILDIVGDNDFRKFKLNSSLTNENVESFLVEGNFAIENNQTVLDLDVRLNKFNLAAFSPLGGDVISDIKGFVTGSSYISGTVKTPEINGRLFLEKTSLKIPYLNTNYAFKENAIIDLSENQFIFQNATLTDTKNNTEGKLNGTIKHKNFAKWNLDLIIDSNRLLVLDTEYSENSAYYGKAFIDGRAIISGPTDGLLISVDAKSRKGTDIKIPINNSESVSNSNYIHFISPKEKFNLKNGIVTKSKNYDGLELKFNLDINPEADIEVILDRNTGHGMKGKGNGNLLLEINTLGKFKMTGDYIVDKGTYNFKYKGIIDKKFDLKKGSYISWEGDPMRARLNLEARYKVSGGANPAVLLDNPSVNKKVDVEVGISITGNLSSPEPDFNVNFPTISPIIQSEIQTKLSDKDIRQTQALTLLATGGFVTNEGLNKTAVTQNLVETGVSLFGDIFQNPDDKFKIDPYLVSAENTPGKEVNGRVGFTVSSQINERVSINGKFGVPVGGVNESAVVGNLEVQYRVNEDGTLNLRFFNKENDISYIGEGIGYTQGLGINYNVDFDTFTELLNKIFKSKKIEIVKNPETDVPDSTIPPEGMVFPDKKKKKGKDTPKTNNQAVPPKDD